MNLRGGSELESEEGTRPSSLQLDSGFPMMGHGIKSLGEAASRHETSELGVLRRSGNCGKQEDLALPRQPSLRSN